jgi:hypothetical protein
VTQLEADWDPGKLWQQAEIDAIVTVGNGDGITIQDEGDAGRLLNEATTYMAEYRSPFAVHASSGGAGRAGRCPARQGARLVSHPGGGAWCAGRWRRRWA